MKAGSIHARAKAAGMSTKDFAEKHKGEDSPVGKLARMYYNVGSYQSGKSESAEPGDHRLKRQPLYQVG